MKGSRVQAVVQELRGEKIDIVPYDRDPARFVMHAIEPAEVARSSSTRRTHAMELVVPDEKLSLAIGQKGQNVRLAVAAHGLEARHHQRDEVPRDGGARRSSRLASIEGVSAELAETFFREGWRSAAEVASAKPDELAAVAGVGGGDAAKAIIGAASKAAELERVRYAEEAARAAARQRPLAEAEANGTAATPPAAADAAGTPRGAEAR